MIHKYKAFLKASHEMASLKTEQIYNVTEIDFKDKYVTIEDDKGMIDVVGFEDCELLQFTGLKDKNGVEIFEGDIYTMGDIRIKYKVVWRDSGLIGKQISSSSYAGLEHWISKIEVIGNIYQQTPIF